jgi:hypothetical protein
MGVWPISLLLCLQDILRRKQVLIFSADDTNHIATSEESFRVVMQSNKFVKSIVQCLVKRNCCHLEVVVMRVMFVMVRLCGSGDYGGKIKAKVD